MPVAMAPDDTRITSLPRPWAAASASTSGPIWPTFGPDTDDDPTFTTMRRAVGMPECEVTLVTVVRPGFDGGEVFRLVDGEALILVLPY